MPRPQRLFIVSSLMIVLVLLVTSVGQVTASPYPNSMASTGDSITRAFNTGRTPFLDAPQNSWSTGTNNTVNSLYTRFLAVNPAIKGHKFNDAVSGAVMADLAGQVTQVNSQHVEYVTILMGANDACKSTEAEMTSVATFGSQFQTAMSSLTAGSPNARIYVLSIPNVYNLWAILKDNSSARSKWSRFSICQSMLANPLSTAQADVDRRNRVRQRVIDFNTQLQQVCAQYPQCHFDGNAVFNTPFTPVDVSTRDYFHPSLQGQTLLAGTAWTASGFAP